MTVKTINVHHTADLEGIYCPACGAAIHEKNQVPEKCKHVLFSYVDVCGEFEYVAPSMEEIVAEARKRAKAENENPVEFALNQLDLASILCWSLTTEGAACGPTSITCTVAVDFDAE